MHRLNPNLSLGYLRKNQALYRNLLAQILPSDHFSVIAKLWQLSRGPALIGELSPHPLWEGFRDAPLDSEPSGGGSPSTDLLPNCL